jgi:magnesium-transporting ATPase (P-type)
VVGGYLYVLLRAGWSPGDATGAGTPLHEAYLGATTITFLGIVACQVGTAFASRTERAALRDVGVLSNRLLLWGVAFELVFAAALVLVPPLQSIFDTAVPHADELAIILPFPLVAWGADELRRARLRRAASP